MATHQIPCPYCGINLGRDLPRRFDPKAIIRAHVDYYRSHPGIDRDNDHNPDDSPPGAATE